MWSGADRGKGEKVVGRLIPGRRKRRIPKIKAVRKTSTAVEGLVSALGSECRRLQWAWVELVRLVWKHRRGGATKGLFNCFLNSCIPEEEEALGWHL